MNEANFGEIHRNSPGGLSEYRRQTIMRIFKNDPRVIQVHIDNILSEDNAELFANSLVGNTHLQYVCFGNDEYDSDHVDMILSALTETNVIGIGIWPLAANTVSRRVIICSNYYATRIGETIESMPMINRLEFRGCSLGPSTAISLAENIIGNKTLDHIDLSDNTIGDDGAIAFANALHKNNTLKELILDNNTLSLIGQRALRNSIYDDEDSNHTIQTFFAARPTTVLGRAVMNDCFHSLAANLRSRSKKEAITKKIHRYLKKKYGVKLRHQSVLGMRNEVMPHLLGFVSMRCDVETMRDIIRHMPHLLEMGGKLDKKNDADELNEQLDLLKI